MLPYDAIAAAGRWSMVDGYGQYLHVEASVETSRIFFIEGRYFILEAHKKTTRLEKCSTVHLGSRVEGPKKYIAHRHTLVTFAIIDCWGEMRPLHLLGFVLKLDIDEVLGLFVVTVVRRFCDVIVK
eukprot:scaffold13641_cov42-Cyclotella_meneghiniana.AAC.11